MSYTQARSLATLEANKKEYEQRLARLSESMAGTLRERQAARTTRVSDGYFGILEKFARLTHEGHVFKADSAVLRHMYTITTVLNAWTVGKGLVDAPTTPLTRTLL